MRWRRTRGRPDGPTAPATRPQSTEPGEPTTTDRVFGEASPPDAAAGGQPAGTDGASGAVVPPDVPVDLGRVDEDQVARATRRAVARALAEDLGEDGDVTGLATIPPGMTGTADLVAREDGVLCGTALVAGVFDQVDGRVDVSFEAADGDQIAAGQVVGRISGPLRAILAGERTALNFCCHLSGIATRTRAFADAVAGTGCVVRDTRKTTPGLRILEKYAVHTGGGANHRIGLYDALLVKDNHIVAAGSVTAAVHGALDRAHGRHVQVEVSSMAELEEALEAGAIDILLDNFAPDEIRQAVSRVAGRASLEASGTIRLDTVREYAQAGVDRVAVGAITHSAPWLDLALDLDTEGLSRPLGWPSSPAPGPAPSGPGTTDPAEHPTGEQVWTRADERPDEPPAATPSATAPPVPPAATPIPPRPSDRPKVRMHDWWDRSDEDAGDATDDAVPGPDEVFDDDEGGLFAWRERQDTPGDDHAASGDDHAASGDDDADRS